MYIIGRYREKSRGPAFSELITPFPYPVTLSAITVAHDDAVHVIKPSDETTSRDS
jgi:hypothetical protein